MWISCTIFTNATITSLLTGNVRICKNVITNELTVPHTHCGFFIFRHQYVINWDNHRKMSILVTFSQLNCSCIQFTSSVKHWAHQNGSPLEQKGCKHLVPEETRRPLPVLFRAGLAYFKFSVHLEFISLFCLHSLYEDPSYGLITDRKDKFVFQKK